MPDVLLGICVVLMLISSLVFLFLGVPILRNVPVVQRLHNTKSALGTVKIPRDRLSRGTFALSDVCLKRLEKMGVADSTQTFVDYKDKRFGDVIALVYYKELMLYKIIGELKIYAFLVIMIGIASGTKNISAYIASMSAFDAWELIRHLGHAPMEIVPVMIVLFVARLAMELMSMTSLLECTG